MILDHFIARADDTGDEPLERFLERWRRRVDRGEVALVIDCHRGVLFVWRPERRAA